MNEAVLAAKQRKERHIRAQELEQRAAENRLLFTKQSWSFEDTKAFMTYRATQLFKGEFILDDDNKAVFDLLCLYFSEDKEFLSTAKAMGVKGEVSLNKGIMLCGSYGVGKSWLFKLFAQNRRQTFYIRNAKDIANDYQRNGVESFEKYLELFKNAVNDPATMFQPYSGLCIDDFGAEDFKNNYGNKVNVIGDLIEQRYYNGLMVHEKYGPVFHASTNLVADDLKKYYGERVTSRLRESVNFIQLPGKDRRK